MPTTYSRDAARAVAITLQNKPLADAVTQLVHEFRLSPDVAKSVMADVSRGRIRMSQMLAARPDEPADVHFARVDRRLLQFAFCQCVVEFQQRMERIAVQGGKDVLEVYLLWRRYAEHWSDQSPLVCEFVQGSYARLGLSREQATELAYAA